MDKKNKYSVNIYDFMSRYSLKLLTGVLIGLLFK